MKFNAKRSRWLTLVIGYLPYMAIASTGNSSGTQATYSGMIGTDLPGLTVNSAGIAIQQSQNRAQAYLFFSQTLANQIYYEVRLYGAYNYPTIRPLFSSSSFYNSALPLGYGTAGFIGYDFKPTKRLDIVPYLRLNLRKNMAQVYSDDQGNTISSLTEGLYLGTKLTLKAAHNLSPTINLWAGRQNILLTGTFPSAGQTSGPNSAVLAQNLIALQLGLNIKIGQAWNILPYSTLGYLTNIPDATASKAYNNGGFNLRPRNNFQPVFGLKLSYSW